MCNHPLLRNRLMKIVFARLILAIPVLFAMLFLPAGTFAYWEAWMYLASIFIPMLFVLTYLYKNDPGLLERRMRVKEKETAQKRIVALAFLCFFCYRALTNVLNGHTCPFSWSSLQIFLYCSVMAWFFLFSESIPTNLASLK
jgi:hypothetical protein